VVPVQAEEALARGSSTRLTMTSRSGSLGLGVGIGRGGELHGLLKNLYSSVIIAQFSEK
jgi:hypothetical protein